jgi:acetyl-CoA C-acetyltransferase
MSASPHVLLGSRDGQRMGDWKMVDTMIVDGLWDVYNQYHMGITAENVAKQYGITARCRTRWRWPASRRPLPRRTPAVQGRDRAVSHPAEEGRPMVFAADEFINRKTNAEALAGLRPAFDKAGSVTAATPRASTTAPPPWW